MASRQVRVAMPLSVARQVGLGELPVDRRLLFGLVLGPLTMRRADFRSDVFQGGAFCGSGHPTQIKTCPLGSPVELSGIVSSWLASNHDDRWKQFRSG